LWKRESHKVGTTRKVWDNPLGRKKMTMPKTKNVDSKEKGSEGDPKS